MYHSRWKGSHYEAGYKYGERLFNHGINLDLVKKINKEKLNYGRQVMQLYKDVYPEIIQEIKGLSDGLKEDFEYVFSFLTTMYVFTFNNYCSCIAISNKSSVLLGRNSDFDISIEKITDSTFYNLRTGYSFVGNTTAMIQMEDGMNEKGLACGLTFVYPTVKNLGFNAGFLVRYILEKCKTTEEAFNFLKKVKIGSSQNIIVIDTSGKILQAELNSERKNFKKSIINEYSLFTTNHFNSKEMLKFKYNGEDDIASHDRYKTFSSENYELYDVKDLKELLSGKKGFLCQYDRKQGFDTIWSTIYDVGSKKIYRCEGNPSRKKWIEDSRLKLSY